MPDFWMDVDAALSEVPVNIMPLLDDTDFKSIEGAVAYNATGMALRWHFVTTAGAYTVTSVTPTTGGNYDWTDQGDSGIYTIEIPASGGASINNDTEGFGWFTGVATGVLPWRGPTIGFRAAGLNNLLIDDAYSATRGLAGTALPAAAADAAGGLPISDAGGLDMDAILARIGTPTNLGGGTATLAGNLADIEAQTDDIGAAGAGLTALATAAALATVDDFLDTEVAAILAAVDTEVAAIKAKTDSLTFTVANQIDANVIDWKGATAPAMTGDAYARLGAPAGASVSADIAAVKAQTAAIETDTQDLQTQVGTDGAGLTALPWNAAWDAEVQSEAQDAITASALATAANLATLAGYVDTEVAAILADTNELQTDWANGGRLDLILDAASAPSAATVADAVWDEALSGHSTAGTAGKKLTDLVNADLSGLATAAALATVDDFLDTEVAAILAAVDTEVAAIKAKTDSLTFTVANQIDANVIDWKGATAPAMTGDAYARLGAPAGASVSADIAAVKAQTAAIETDTQDLQTQVGTDGAGLTALPWNAAWDAEVQSEAQDAITASALATAANLATLAGYVDTEVAAILADTNELQTDWANGGRLDLILDAASAPSAATVADAVWDEAIADHSGAGSTGAALSASGDKTGYKLASDGLDAISTTAPAGVASNFREMVVQTWRRLFKKQTMTATELKTFGDDGTAILTTQAVSDDGITQTIGSAT